MIKNNNFESELFQFFAKHFKLRISIKDINIEIIKL